MSFARIPAARQSVRAELGIPTDATAVGIIATFVPLKNHRLFVAGAGLALRANPGMHFLMIGDGLTHDSPDLTAWIGPPVIPSASICSAAARTRPISSPPSISSPSPPIPKPFRSCSERPWPAEPARHRCRRCGPLIE